MFVVVKSSVKMEHFEVHAHAKVQYLLIGSKSMTLYSCVNTLNALENETL